MQVTEPQTDRRYQVETLFTVRQLERLRQLVGTANTRQPNPDDHNLERKLTEYLVTMQRIQLRRTG